MCMALMMGMFISDNAYSQTGGTLSLNVTTTFTGGAFGARSDFVVWIENSSTTFVKTRAIYGNDRDHLVQWISKTATQNVVDATVGATTTTNPKSYTAILWNGSDLTGTTPYNLLPDGTYKIGMECAWGSNNTIVTSRQIYYATFTKGPTPQTITPNDTVNFTGITLQWTPSNLVVTTSALASNTYFLGSLVSVPFTLGTGTVYRNNVWTAQLSDETGSFASPVTIGTLTSTTAGTISATIPAIATLGAGYRIRVVGSQPSAIGSDNGSNITLAVPVSAPSLTAAVGATVDNPVNITFTDDAAWRTAITAVKIGSTSLVPTTDYVISAGNLQLKPVGLNVLLTTFGSKNITVVATGYADATVTQSIDVGVAAKLGMKTQPAAPAVNGGALAVQPAVYIQDQYGNTTTSTAVVNAIVGSGVWVLGGTSAVSAIAGTTTFSGLTATATANIMGTITFTSVGLTSVTSTSFNIPFVGQSWGNTAGSLSFTINPVSRSTSNYTLNHVAASWIENTSGTFVKTRNRYTGTSNQSHLTSWRATTGSTYSVVDATTAATLNAYNPITITSWLGNDLTGATPYNLLPDGEYKVWFEMSWDDATTEADRISVQFTKGPTLFTASPANTTNFTGMTVIWTPAAANTITTSALAGSTYAAGATVSVPFTIGVGTVYNNNVWTAQLSDATGNFASPINIGTLNTTTAGSISATIPMGAPAGSGYRIRVIGSQPQAAGTDNGTNFTITNGVSPSIAAATAATVDNAFEITYTDDAIWRAAITGVTVGGTTLTAGWVVSAGKITFSPSASVPANLLQASGSKIITIVAAGYGDASVIQMLGPGIATKLGMKTQAAAPATNGALFAIQPEVYVQDQFGNTVISSAIVSAAVGTGSWILGGTTVDTASLGIASFVDLTGSTSTFGGSTITFSSPGLTSVSCNTFYIPYPLSGNLTVGTSGNFTSFTKADGLFSVINSSGMSGNTSISVTSDIAIEDGVTALNQWVEYGGSGYTLTIQPSGGVSRTISGTAAAPLLNFNGADRVTINGLNTGGNALVISNLSTATTAGTSTIQFINDATNNTITNCSILGSSTAALTTNGGNILFNTGTITGNDSITISNCKIGPAGTNLPSKGIYANGSTASVAIANSTVLINNCEIYDFFLTSGCAGIYALTGNTDWSITNNKVYQTATRTFTAAGTMSGIYFVNSTYGNNIQITGNTVGYASNSATGTLTLTGSAIAGVFQGIYMQAMNAAANTCNVNFNVVSDISFTSASGAFTGIYNNTGATSNTININSNQIKNIATITTTGTVQGIYAGSATNLNCSSNTIDGISRNISGNFYPVRYNAPTNIIFDGNTIKNKCCYT